jgi:hypothetical protein
MTNIIQSNQDVAVSEYVVRIKAEMTKATTAWKSIADILAAAANDFGMQSDLMRSLLKQTQFSESKAVKLIAVANSKRIQDHSADLQSVDAWTVLYQITTLSDEEFQRLLDKLEADEIITASVVNAARDKKERDDNPYQTTFSIQIDKNAIKSAAFDQYQELHDLLQKIQDTMSYVRVVETPFYENTSASIWRDVERKYHLLATALVNDEMTKYRKRRKKEWDAATQQRKFYLANAMEGQKDYIKKRYSQDDTFKYGSLTKEEMNDLKRSHHYEEALEALGATDVWDEGALWDEAQSAVLEKREKRYGPKATSPDLYANTEIQVAA